MRFEYVTDNYSEKEVTEVTMKLPAILIYIVVCCCGLIMFVSSAQIYTCWKSGLYLYSYIQHVRWCEFNRSQIGILAEKK